MKKPLAVVAGLALTSLVLAGCSAATPDASESGSDELAYPEIHAMLPDEIKERGYINNAMQLPNAPLEFEDENGTLTGIDPTLIEAVSEVLGVEIRTQTTNDFASMLPSLETGRVDMVFSAVLSTDERRASGFSFVDYFQSYTTFMIRADDADKIVDFEDLCGLTVTGDRGTQYPDLAEQVSQEHCVANGLEPIEVIALGAIPVQISQMQQGRSDAILMGVEYEAYEMTKAPGEFAILDEQLDPATYGIVGLAEDESLLEAVQAALEVLYESGVYEEALTEWSLAGSGLSEFPLRSGVK